MTDTVPLFLLVSALAFLVGFAMLVPVGWHREFAPGVGVGHSRPVTVRNRSKYLCERPPSVHVSTFGLLYQGVA
jgi:hypothetical protein